MQIAHGRSSTRTTNLAVWDIEKFNILMNSCGESKHVETKFEIIFLFLLSVATRAGSPHQHVPITVGSRCANFREEGKHSVFEFFLRDARKSTPDALTACDTGVSH